MFAYLLYAHAHARARAHTHTHTHTRGCAQMRELMEEKYRLEEVAEQQKNDLLRLRSVLLQVQACVRGWAGGHA